MTCWHPVLVAMVALAPGCEEEPCGIRCVSPPARTLTIEFEGTGRGWVQIMEGSSELSPAKGTGLVCTETCTLEVPSRLPATYFVRAGTTQHITASSCGLETYDRECGLTGVDEVVSVTFDKDPDEDATLFLDDNVQALARFSDGDLAMGMLGSVRRVGIDGTERWRVPRTNSTLVATSAAGLVVVGPDVGAYRGDGSLAWDVPYEAVAVAMLPDGNPIIATTDGRVIALSAVDGSIRWQSGDVGATMLAVDDAGNVAAGADQTIVRFNASGASMSSWQAPTSLEHLLFDNTSQLAATHLEPPNTIAGEVDTTVDYYRFDGTGTPTKVFRRGSLEPNGFVAAGDRLFHWGRRTFAIGSYPPRPPLLDLVAMDATGAMTWELIKGYGSGFKQIYGSDLITPSAAVCDPTRRCAVAGTFSAPDESHMSNWVGVYTVR